jgi:hypothetical protein
LAQKLADLVKFTLEKQKISKKKKSHFSAEKKQQILSEIKSLIMNLSICLFLAKFCHLGTNKRENLPTCEKNPPNPSYFKG